MRVLVFGDSITQGMYDSRGGWFDRLRNPYDMAAAANPGSDDNITFFNLGVSGDMAANVFKRFAIETENRRRLEQDFALIFAVGINDTYMKGQNGVSTPELYAETLDAIFAAAGHYSDRILFVGLTPCDEAKTVPVSWGLISYFNDRILQFEEVLRKFCIENKLSHVQVFEKFQEQQKKENLLADGLHPNDAGHQLIADLVKLELDKLLSS